MYSIIRTATPFYFSTVLVVFMFFAKIVYAQDSAIKDTNPVGTPPIELKAQPIDAKTPSLDKLDVPQTGASSESATLPLDIQVGFFFARIPEAKVGVYKTSFGSEVQFGYRFLSLAGNGFWNPRVALEYSAIDANFEDENNSYNAMIERYGLVGENAWAMGSWQPFVGIGLAMSDIDVSSAGRAPTKSSYEGEGFEGSLRVGAKYFAHEKISVSPFFSYAMGDLTVIQVGFLVGAYL